MQLVIVLTTSVKKERGRKIDLITITVLKIHKTYRFEKAKQNTIGLSKSEATHNLRGICTKKSDNTD